MNTLPITTTVLYSDVFMDRTQRLNPPDAALHEVYAEEGFITEDEFDHLIICGTEQMPNWVQVVCGSLFDTLNLDDGAERPRSMSVGDVVRFTIGESSLDFVCNPVGWKKR